MKIEDARQRYSAHIKAYREKQTELAKQKQELESKIRTTPDGKTEYAEEAAILELTMQAVDEKQSEYKEYMEKLLEQWSAVSNMVSAKQHGEAMAEHADDLAKVLEVARRIMKGDIVPPADEKKLLDHSPELYQAAKNIGAIARQKEKEKHDSLWDEEKETSTVSEDSIEVANNTEAFAEGPEIVSVEEVVASVAVEE